MPIPILKLPFLALKVVMDYLDNVELLKTSVCNRKANRVVKVCRGNSSIFNIGLSEMNRFTDSDKFQLLLSEDRNSDVKENLGVDITRLKIVVSDVLSLNFIVRWDIRFTITIDYLSNMKSYKGFQRNLNIEGTYIPLMISNNQLYTFWMNQVQGLQFFLKYFETNFRLIYCNWEFENFTPDLKPLVTYLNSLPKETNYSEDIARVQSVSVGKYSKLSHSDYNYLLGTVKHFFEGYKKTPIYFEFTGRFATQKLVLSSAHWFKLEHLLGCKCDYVHVEGSQFTNHQLNVFMQKWSTGELPHLQRIQVQLKEKLDLNVILWGIKIIPMTHDPTIGWMAPIRKPTKLIQGITGLRANVNNGRKLNPGMFVLTKL